MKARLAQTACTDQDAPSVSEQGEYGVHTGMCFVLGFMSRDHKKGLCGSVERIKQGIGIAKKTMRLTNEQVARLETMFNVRG